MAHETVEKFRRSRVHPDLEDLRPMAARWAEDHAGDLRGIDPVMPDALDNRTEDNWEPLFAIAEAIGGEWPEQLRLAVKTLAHEDEDRRIELLGDLRTICEATGAAFLPTKEIIEELLSLTERPYQTINDNKAINAHWLARQLKAFGLKSARWRPTNGSGTQIRGYHVKPLLEVGSRYLRPSVRNVSSVTDDSITDPAASTELSEVSEASETDKGGEGDTYTEKHYDFISRTFKDAL
jgi:putative DNA primase/helicase